MRGACWRVRPSTPTNCRASPLPTGHVLPRIYALVIASHSIPLINPPASPSRPFPEAICFFLSNVR
jgi:hypothetical protein